MGLNINRKASPPGNAGLESSTLGSACYEYRRIVGEDHRPVATTDVADFTNKNQVLDNESVKRLFDHIWKTAESDRSSNFLLDLSQVRSADPLFKTELTYLSRQLHHQRRFVRLSCVSLEGDWDNWL
jgi:hypothetical protein